LHFTSSRKYMGKYANGWFLLVAGWTTCVLITALDLYGLPQLATEAWRVIAGP
jgi:manganese transport protein